MKRREFITLLRGAALTWPLAALGLTVPLDLLGLADEVID